MAGSITVIPPDKKSSFADSFSRLMSDVQDRALRSRQIDIQEAQQKVLEENERQQDDMFRSIYTDRLNQMKREADVKAKTFTPGPKSKTDVVYADYNAFKGKTPNEQIAYGASVANTAVATNTYRQSQQEIASLNAAMKAQQAQLNAQKFINNSVNSVVAPLRAGAKSGEALTYAQQYAQTYRKSLTNQDPKQTESLNASMTLSMKNYDAANLTQNELDINNAKSQKQGNYSQKFIESLPERLQVQAYQHYDETGELLDIRYLPKGWLPGGRPGNRLGDFILSPDASTELPYSQDTATDAGFTMKDWRKAKKTKEILGNDARRKEPAEKKKTQTDTSKAGVKIPKGFKAIR